MTEPTGREFAVVTGASSGIGYELARQFAQNGYDLLIAAEDDGIEVAATDVSRDGRTRSKRSGSTLPPTTAWSSCTGPSRSAGRWTR